MRLSTPAQSGRGRSPASRRVCGFPAPGRPPATPRGRAGGRAEEVGGGGRRATPGAGEARPETCALQAHCGQRAAVTEGVGQRLKRGRWAPGATLCRRNQGPDPGHICDTRGDSLGSLWESTPKEFSMVIGWRREAPERRARAGGLGLTCGLVPSISQRQAPGPGALLLPLPSNLSQPWVGATSPTSAAAILLEPWPKVLQQTLKAQKKKKWYVSTWILSKAQVGFGRCGKSKFSRPRTTPASQPSNIYCASY